MQPRDRAELSTVETEARNQREVQLKTTQSERNSANILTFMNAFGD